MILVRLSVTKRHLLIEGAADQFKWLEKLLKKAREDKEHVCLRVLYMILSVN